MSALAPVRVAARAALRAPAEAPPKPSRPARPATRPSLRVVPAARVAASRLPFALLVAGILGSGLVALLMLHTLAAQDAFSLHSLQRQSATLSDTEQELTVVNQQAQAPSSLATRAKALGMVPAGSLRIVRRHGRIVAVTTAAAPAAAPAVVATPAARSGRAQPNSSAKPSSKTVRHPKPRPPH